MKLVPLFRRLGIHIIADGGYRGESTDVLKITQRNGIYIQMIQYSNFKLLF